MGRTCSTLCSATAAYTHTVMQQGPTSAADKHTSALHSPHIPQAPKDTPLHSQQLTTWSYPASILYFCKIHLNNTTLQYPRSSPQYHLSARYSNLHCMHLHLISPAIFLPDTACWRVQITKLLITQFSPFLCQFLLLRPKYNAQHCGPTTPSVPVLLLYSKTRSTSTATWKKWNFNPWALVFWWENGKKRNFSSLFLVPSSAQIF